MIQPYKFVVLPVIIAKHMSNLEDKYKNDSLTQADLLAFREELNHTSDEQLEARLHASWQNDALDELGVPTERLEALKSRIDQNLSASKRSFKLELPARLGWIAAAVLLPVFMLTTFHFYRQTSILSNEEVLFSALEGERSNVTLPDGTKVTLNSNSSLTYSPGQFNHKERNIQFNGEAYFNVAKNESAPFIIHTHELKVTVLGTKFNLHAYAGNKTMAITLEEGHVLLSSKQEEKELFPHQKAILDCQDGRISIVRDDSPENASAWRNGELVFSNQELHDVLNDLEDTYDISIQMHTDKAIATDLFTGRIPTDNLLDALEILRYSYHMNYQIDKKTIIFSYN